MRPSSGTTALMAVMAIISIAVVPVTPLASLSTFNTRFARCIQPSREVETKFMTQGQEVPLGMTLHSFIDTVEYIERRIADNKRGLRSQSSQKPGQNLAARLLHW